MYDEIENFIDELRNKGMANSTIESYEIHLRHFYSYLKQNNLDYKNLSNKDIKNYAYVSKKIGNANSTINTRLSAIKTFFETEAENEIVNYNPIRKSAYLKQKICKTEPLTQEEKNAILTYVETKEQHIELGFKVLFTTGLRVSELANLRKEDVTVINNRVVVHVYNTKNDNERYVPVFDTETARELLTYVRDIERDIPIFRVKKRTFQYHAEQISNAIGILFTIHQTRHTFATEMLQTGIRLDILQKLLGHKDISTTMLYAKTMNIDVINTADPIKI